MKHTKWYNQIMKLPKKIYLAAAILLFTAGGTTVYALQSEPTVQKEDTVQLTSTVAEPEAPAQQEVAVEQPVAPAPAPQAVEPEPEPSPVYGEYKPGVCCKIFNPEQAMSEAGITENDMPHVKRLVESRFNWYYHPQSDTYNLFNTQVSTKTGYPDFATNPITQLRWANERVINKHGNWSKVRALEDL